MSDQKHPGAFDRARWEVFVAACARYYPQGAPEPSDEDLRMVYGKAYQRQGYSGHLAALRAAYAVDFRRSPEPEGAEARAAVEKALVVWERHAENDDEWKAMVELRKALARREAIRRHELGLCDSRCKECGE